MLHIFVKALELLIAPAIGLVMAILIEPKFIKQIITFLVIHAGTEILSGFFGFIYIVDASSNYTHSDFYWIYTVAYFISIIYGIFIMIFSMKKYQYNGTAFLAMIIVLLLFGIVVQLWNSEIRVIYFAVAIASVMLYVFTLEMIQQNDELTGLINRRGYENFIAHIEESCLIMIFDVDNFKMVNDKYGHQFGDFCLREIGNSLRQTYSKYGRCFRTGGDEFCVITTKNIDKIEVINSEYFRFLEQRRKNEERLPYVSLGYVFYNPQTGTIQEAYKEADKMMYKFKQEYKKANT